MSTRAADAPILELAVATAAESEARGALAPELVEAMRDAGIYRALVPVALGGGEAHPAAFRDGIELIACADGAAGWCAAIGATAGLAAGYLSAPAAAELFTAETIPAGVFAPRGRLKPDASTDSGDHRLSGRWTLGSAVSSSTLVGLGAVHPDRGALYALVPRREVQVVETWDSLGLRATASHDVAAESIAVPAEHLIDLVGGTPTASGPLYRFPLFGVLAIAVSAVCTGIARGALGDVLALAAERKPAGSSRSLAERATTQAQVAGDVARLRAARSGLDSAIDRAWTLAESDEPLGADERAGLRLAATHAAQVAVEVVDSCHRLGGAGALYRSNPLERRLRDVHTAAQHMVVAPGTLELAGRVLLGLETDLSQL